MKKILLTMLLSATSLSAVAETLYVTDKLWVQLRAGPSIEYKILRNLVSGDALTVLDAPELTSDTYTKVQTSNGLEGYVLTQYLQKETSAKNQLTVANNEISKLKGELETLRQERNELKSSSNKLTAESASLSKSNEQLEQELEQIKTISASAIELNSKYQQLLKDSHNLEVQVQTLTTENSQLHDTRQQTYILYGGGLVFIGILAGLILPSLRGKRNNSNWA